MNLALRARLSAMMFIQFFVWGAWYVTAPSYLSRIGFDGGDIGWTYSVGPIAGMISPLFVGIIADRFFAVERVMGCLHLTGAALMFGATHMMQGEAPDPTTVNGLLFGYMLCYFPTLALSNSLAMRNIDDSEAQFPAIRVLGTIGWIAAGLLLDPLDWSASAGMFHLATGASVVMGLYCFSLPHTPPAPATTDVVSIKSLLGLDALVLLKRPAFAVFIVSSFLICIPLAFYYQMAARTIEAGGIERVPSTMTLGQASEVLFMLVMPFFFKRLGVKWMLAVGMAAWVARYALFAVGVPEEITWMLITGVALHGICYDFFFVTGQIYTDKVAPAHIRSQAQGLLVLFTLGLGMLGGAQIAGMIEGNYTTEEAQTLQAEAGELHRQLELLRAAEPPADPVRIAELSAEANHRHLAHLKAIEWGTIWTFPALAAGAILLLFIALFRDRAAGATATPAG